MNAKIKTFLTTNGKNIAIGVALFVILGLIATKLLGVFPFSSNSSKVTKVENPPKTDVMPPVTIDSTLKKQIDDLNKRFGDYQRDNNARLDSLLNPEWYRELDQKTFENKTKTGSK